ncbi:hypothetical protein DI005_16480 [Prauserella sp. PE36]|uniref:hypothetical protein n=1 Tax=Prauserella sp. PE36 TaxID=1504709 RepID=UPI000D9927A7|nr:hypothetical protein [Prauserella sp. PE36]PXY35285.1 hypothetical protein BAY59_05540 [Prauserella coralliicola]RBM19409.1 hypothetical protein DI005_16480 [Prauserella sp. PE36]
MADEKPTLVLHLVSGGEPLLFSVHPDDVAELTKQLYLYLDHGSVQTIRTREDVNMQVNFAHVAVAYIDDLQRKGKVFGLH